MIVIVGELLPGKLWKLIFVSFFKSFHYLAYLWGSQIYFYILSDPNDRIEDFLIIILFNYLTNVAEIFIGVYCIYYFLRLISILKKWFIHEIFELAIEAMQEYSHFKTQRGLIDYTDMEVKVDELLDNSTVCDILRSEISILMVDEFQDTSPIQLSIFLKLSQNFLGFHLFLLCDSSTLTTGNYYRLDV